MKEALQRWVEGRAERDALIGLGGLAALFILVDAATFFFSDLAFPLLTIFD